MIVAAVINNPPMLGYRRGSRMGGLTSFHFSSNVPRHDYSRALTKRFGPEPTVAWISGSGNAEWPWTSRDGLMYGGM